MFFFLCTWIWSELNYLAICLCNKDPDFIFLFNQLVVYSLPTTMSSVTGNHTTASFSLFIENFKNFLFDSLITRRSFENLSYLSSYSLSQRWRFRRIRSNVLRGIEVLRGIARHWGLRSGVVSEYILRSGSDGTH